MENRLRDYYAAERTLLAWIRTTVAMMAFGFVVARFGIFLEEMRMMERLPVLGTASLSVWFGTLLIAFGVAVNIIATKFYRREIRQLHAEAPDLRASFTLGLWTAGGLAAVGVLMAAYLVAIAVMTRVI